MTGAPVMALRLSPATSCTPFGRRFHHKKLGLGPMAGEIGAARLRNLRKKAAQYEQPFGLSSDEMCAGSIQRSTRSQGRSQLDRR